MIESKSRSDAEWLATLDAWKAGSRACSAAVVGLCLVVGAFAYRVGIGDHETAWRLAKVWAVTVVPIWIWCKHIDAIANELLEEERPCP